MWVDPNVKRKGSIARANILSTQHKDELFPLFSLFELSITGMCNRHCEFCPRVDQDIYPNKNEYLPEDLYRKIMTELNILGYDGIIAFSGFSEPLFHKGLNKFIALAREACPHSRIELYTNGDVLNSGKIIQMYEAGLTSIHISLYDGPEQVDKFIEMRDQAGIDQEGFILRERFLTKEKGYGMTLSNRAGMINFEQLGVERIKEPLRRECFYPFYMMFVDHIGDVVLCSHDWGKKLVVGNLGTESVSEVWKGRIINSARERLSRKDRAFRPCNVCDVQGTFMGKEHFERWKSCHMNTVKVNT